MSNNTYSRTGRVGGKYYSREQRLNQICDAMQHHRFEEDERWFTVREIAKMVSLRPSHHVRGLVGELCAEGWLEKRGGVGRGCCKIRREYRARRGASDIPFVADIPF